MFFKDNLRLLRIRRGLTQGELGAMLNKSESSISEWESGKYSPRSSAIKKLADIFGVSMEELMEEDLSKLNVDFFGEETQYNLGTHDREIPLYASVAAGKPSFITGDEPDFIKLNETEQGDFALRIKGRSMEPRMYEGDIVIVVRQTDVDSGDIAIVMVDDEDATCKKVVKQEEGILLVGLNPDFAPLYYSNRDIKRIPVKILGKVVSLRADL